MFPFKRIGRFLVIPLTCGKTKLDELVISFSMFQKYLSYHQHFSRRNSKTHLYHTPVVPGHTHLIVPHIHKNFSCDRNWKPIPWLILSFHRKLMESIGFITKCRQNIAAGSLEVVGPPIKGEVVRVSRGRAGAMRVGMAAILTLHHTTGLLRTTGVGEAVDRTGCAITGAQVLTFLAIPELLTTLPIASLVIATTGCWLHTLVAVEDKTIITLAPILTWSVTREGERETGARRGTRASTEFIMAV